jgi:hypothetical protein
MSLLRAMFQSQGMKPMPCGEIFARTQWLLVFFWTPQTQVNVGVAAIGVLLSPSDSVPRATFCILACGMPEMRKSRFSGILEKTALFWCRNMVDGRFKEDQGGKSFSHSGEGELASMDLAYEFSESTIRILI